jgi:uncharacterized membrane protein YdjX (TVP38/TMEM64 family)
MPRPASDDSRKAFSNGSGPRWRRWVGLLGVAAALVTVAIVVDVGPLLSDVIEGIAGLGAWGPLLFVLAYVVAAVFFVPGSVLTLGAGAVYGVLWGSVYASIGATLGATAAFLVGRYAARNWVAKKMQAHRKFAAIDQAVGDEGWKIVVLTRLSPIFPFSLLNYAFGLTQVKLGSYVLASWLGMIPGTLLYVYLGSLARAGVAGEDKTAAEWASYGIGLMATIVVAIMITRRAREALAERTGGSR